MPTRLDFANAVMQGIGAEPYEDGQIALVNLFVAEGSKAENNPDDTEEREAGSTDFNSAGVQNFPTFAEGVQAMLDTLNNGLNAEVITSLHQHLSAETVTAAFCFHSSWDSAGDLYLRVLPSTRANFRTLAAEVIAEPDPTPASSPEPPSSASGEGASATGTNEVTPPPTEIPMEPTDTEVHKVEDAVAAQAKEVDAEAVAGKASQLRTTIQLLETHLSELEDLVK